MRFCLALIGKAGIRFTQVRTLKIAKFSSKCITAIQRADFWDALPKLGELMLIVSPDWRDIQLDADDIARSHSMIAFMAEDLYKSVWTRLV